MEQHGKALNMNTKLILHQYLTLIVGITTYISTIIIAEGG